MPVERTATFVCEVDRCHQYPVVAMASPGSFASISPNISLAGLNIAKLLSAPRSTHVSTRKRVLRRPWTAGPSKSKSPWSSQNFISLKWSLKCPYLEIVSYSQLRTLFPS